MLPSYFVRLVRAGFVCDDDGLERRGCEGNGAIFGSAGAALFLNFLLYSKWGLQRNILRAALSRTMV